MWQSHICIIDHIIIPLAFNLIYWVAERAPSTIWILFDYIFRIKRALFILFKMLRGGGVGARASHAPRFLRPLLLISFTLLICVYAACHLHLTGLNFIYYCICTRGFVFGNFVEYEKSERVPSRSTTREGLWRKPRLKDLASTKVFWCKRLHGLI